MSVRVRLGSSETLELTSYDGKQFTLHSPRAFAPGTPLRLELDLGISHTLELKSIGSKKLEEGLFEVRARATTMRKEAREALHKLFAIVSID